MDLFDFGKRVTEKVVPIVVCWLLIVLALLSCVGCKSVEYVPMPYEVSHTEYVHDSIDRNHYHTEWLQGDTLFIHDSIYIDRWNGRTVHDSVDRPYPVPMPPDTVYVERPLTRWQQTKQRGFWWLLAVVGGGILWRTRKIWKTRKIWGKFIGH